MQVISVGPNIHNISRSPSVSPAGHFTVSSKDAWSLFINGEITEEVLLLEKWTAADIARKQREAIEQNELFYWSKALLDAPAREQINVLEQFSVYSLHGR